MSSSSLSGYVYYVSIVDDFSRKTWIYFLKGKNELFSNFKYYQYPIRGSGEASYKLESKKYLKLKDMLYVPKLKSNILSIYALDSKGIIY